MKLECDTQRDARAADLSSEPSPEATTRRPRLTAAGTIAMSAAGFWAGVAGLALSIYLARALGPAAYGVWAVVLSVLVWWEATSTSFWTSSVAKFVSAAGITWEGVARTAVCGGAVWYVGFAAVLFIAAPAIGHVLDDDAITRYLQLFAIDIPIFGLYSVLLSVMAGREQHGRRAAGIALYWTSKLLLMCGLVALGFGITGAVVGSVSASVVGLVLTVSFSRASFGRPSFPIGTLARFSAPILLAALAFRLLQNLDLWMVKGLLKDSALAGRYGVAAGIVQAGAMVYFALAPTVLPSVSRAIAQRNDASARNTVQQAYRFLFVVMGLLIGIVGADARPIIVLAFSNAYASAAPAAAVLTGAALALALTGIGQTILIAASRPGWAVAALLPLLPIDLAINLALIPRLGLVGAALATLVTGLVGVALTGALVWRELKVLFEPLTLGRVAAATLMTYAMGTVLGASGPLVLAECAALSVLYVGVLIGLGELGRHDLELVTRWTRRPPEKAPSVTSAPSASANRPEDRRADRGSGTS